MQSSGVSCRKNVYGSLARQPKKKFFFQLLLVDNIAVINNKESNKLISL